MKYLEMLNEAQKTAVLETEGPVLVLAGAGAGKTRTIAHRIVHLVKSGVPSHNILALTFTNKAAREMRERVEALLAEYGESASSQRVTVSTFHALCVILLRQYAETLGFKKHFTIYDRSDSLRAIKRAMKAVDENEKQIEPRVVLSAISRAKGDTKTLSTYREETGNSYFPLVVSKVWEQYERILHKDNALDFDDLLLEVWKMLTNNREIRTALVETYRYIHVDEYQDTNKVQYEIVRMLADEHKNLFCVGDLDQNIYSWRGSTIENILEFEKTFPEATVIRLEENYRSTGTIIEVSNEIIKKNKRRKEKTLFTNNTLGEKITLIMGFNEHDEAERIVSTIKERMELQIPAKDIAVLYRANFQSRVLEEACLGAGIPYKVLGTRFFDRKEVKDTLAYIKVALNPESESDIVRTINTPIRGIGKITVSKLLQQGCEAFEGRTREKIDTYFKLLSNIKNEVMTKKASEVLVYTLEHSGLNASLQGKGEEEEERLQNIRELVSLAVTRYDQLPSPDGTLRLLEDAALATDQDELDQKTTRNTGEGVTLMTIHAAKGLEYGHVFITGLEDGLFPHERKESMFGSAVDDEEERRLFYVALTRAKEKVYLSYAQSRTIFGQRLQSLPSEFLLDIDESYLEPQDTYYRKPESTGKVIYLD
ncbi:TPA: ATP-dependent DNA helicase PcrA [Patescibacteria group bacterium]|nr:MAG: ATP-dependent DNA helicase PcrA [Parcubacteria group bacterium GW2011_GWD2_42_14]HCC05255.1 ATP-dependent DNA helicase PcrA [Patescibacteria group bacterium]